MAPVRLVLSAGGRPSLGRSGGTISAGHDRSWGEAATVRPGYFRPNPAANFAGVGRDTFMPAPRVRWHHAVRSIALILATSVVALIGVAPTSSAAVHQRLSSRAASAMMPSRSAVAKMSSNTRDHLAVRIAATQRGKLYRYGATGPRAYDCSGLVKWVYNTRLFRHLPRTAAQQYGATRHIAKRATRPGDLIFFTQGSHVYHVGIYAGSYRIWHAPHAGARVRLERIWTAAFRVGRLR